jgi:two-component system, cell cycle sensor histidine kinase and response regulator CckA
MSFRESHYNLIMISEEKYRLLFENSKEAVFMTTPDGRYIDMNPAGVEMFGYASRDEMLGLDINTDIFSDPDARKRYAKKLEEDGYVKDYRMELKRKDGSRLIALTTATVVKNERGEIIAYHGMNHDITARDRESEALRENMERLDLALRAANMGVWHWDIINQKIDYDEQSFHLLGIDPSTFKRTREDFYNVVHPDDREKIRLSLLRRIEDDDAPSMLEFRIIWPDGTIRHLTGRGKAVRDDAGKPVRMHGIQWDITEQKRAETQLKKSNELLRVIIETAPTAIIGLDLEGKVHTVWNRAAEKMLGWSAEEAMGRYLPSVPVDNEEEFRRFREFMRSGNTMNGVEVARRKSDGTPIYYSIYASPLRDENGAVLGNIAVLVDITNRKSVEEALRESEERLKLTLDAAHIVAWEINVDGSHHEAGPVHKLFGKPEGFSHPELSDLYESIHPDDREGMKTLVREALQDKRKYYIEFRVPQQNGSVQWIEATGRLLKDTLGKPVRLLGVARNITERKLAEEALRKSEKRTKSIIQALPIGMHMYRMENDGRLIFTGANPAADKILGVEHGQLVGKTIEEAFPALLETDIPQHYREVAATGEMWYTEQINYHHGVIQGAYEVYAFQTSPGNMGAAFEDITERKKMDEALRRSEERFKLLVQNSNDIIILLNESGALNDVNGPVERILGYTPEELIGKPAFDLVHPDDLATVAKAFEDSLAMPNITRVVEYRYRHKDGRWMQLEAVGANLLNDPVVKAIVVSVRDISERKKFQEQLQQAMKMEAVGRLAGGVAHDFNNILTVISGNIELARMGLSPSDPLTRRLEQMARAADSAASLTRQLLAFSRRQIIEPRVLNLNDLIKNIDLMLRRLIGENIELKTILRKDLDSVRVDPGQFEQVLVNLVVNARDAMPDGGNLIIETDNVALDENYSLTHPESIPGQFILLAVSDTGHGMSDEVKDHIFEPFFTTKGIGHGTGLGLATIFGIVKQAGGSIEVYSETGEGTTFKIYLPMIEGQAEKLSKSQPAHALPKGRETILFVEDEANVRMVGMMMLAELGYNVIEARNGIEALAFADKYKDQIDLLMTDIVLPGMNGRELAERLIKIRPEIKTLFTSGYTEDVIVHHGVIDARINFIGKPYSLQPLAKKLRDILDK